MQAVSLKCVNRLLSRSLLTSRSRLHSIDQSFRRDPISYPLFNLNDEFGRSLGPQAGDEAILTLSGGVDSSVAAYLAIERGGLIPKRTIFMRNWNSLEEAESFEPGAGGSSGCQWKKDWEKVIAMAKYLGVEAELMDLSAPYWNSVFSPSLDEWSKGWTPNPDILCNREIKFGELLHRLDEETEQRSAAFGRRRAKRWLVTGHYAGVRYFYPTLGKDEQHGALLRAKDATKDQSYFLSAVSSKQLGRTHFPLSKMTKVQVRHLAKEFNFPTSDSEESMGLCFIGERRGNGAKLSQGEDSRNLGGFAGFLAKYIKPHKGDIIDHTGRAIGKHQGLHTVTIGQGAKIGGSKERLFVASKDSKTNTITVVPGSDHPWLQCHQIEMKSFFFLDPSNAQRLKSGDIQAQIRHRQSASPCQVRIIGESVIVRLIPSIASVAEGQICALYQANECLGSGIITCVEANASRKTSLSDTFTPATMATLSKD